MELLDSFGPHYRMEITLRYCVPFDSMARVWSIAYSLHVIEWKECGNNLVHLLLWKEFYGAITYSLHVLEWKEYGDKLVHLTAWKECYGAITYSNYVLEWKEYGTNR